MISIAAPDSVQHGTPTKVEGTDMDQVDNCNIKLDDDSVSIPQSITLNGGDLDMTPDTGHGAIADVPQTALPFKATSLASGTTEYQVVLEVTSE